MYLYLLYNSLTNIIIKMETTNNKINSKKLSEIRTELKKYRGAINMVAIKAGVNHPYASMVLSEYINTSHANYKVIEAAIEVLKELREKDKQMEEKINQA
jgi:hypothetical protein